MTSHDLNHRNYLSLLVLFICLFGFGQENETTYFLTNNSSKISINPALYETNSFAKHFDFTSASIQTNTNLNYTDLVKKVSEKSEHSLVLDLEGFTSTSKNTVFFDLRSVGTVFQVGLHVNSKQVIKRRKTPRYIRMSVKQKLIANLNFDNNYLLLLTKGNAKFDQQSFSTGHAGINAYSYTEIGMTHSRPITQKLTVGVTVKTLFGLFNFNTKKFELYFNTNDIENAEKEDHTYNISAIARLQMSGPIDIFLNADSYIDRVAFSPVTTPIELANPGFAFDIGTVFQMTSKLRVGASIKDIGSIWWYKSPKQLTVDATYQFEPYDLGNFIDSDQDESVTDWIDHTLENLKETFQQTKLNTAYTEKLPLIINSSVQYQINPIFDIGVLYTYRINQNFKYSNIMLSANLGMDRFSLSPVLVLQNDDYFIGCSGAVNIGHFQLTLAINDIKAVANPAYAHGLGGGFHMSYLIPLKKRFP
jgi:hypothetical protein